MADGSKKRIDAVAVNDLVLSMDDRRMEKLPARVTDITRFDSFNMAELTFTDGNVLQATLRHPFFKTDGTRIRASEVKAGDQLLCLAGRAEVRATSHVPGRKRAYMLALDGGQSFYAGGISALGGVVKDF